MFIDDDKICSMKRCKVYTYMTAQILYTATKQTTSTYCNYNSWQSTFYRVYFIINYKHLNRLILFTFLTLVIFVILAK